VNRSDVLKSWAERWRGLKTWGRDLTEVKFKFVPYKGGKLGCASFDRTAEIRETASIYCDFATVLHELAHLATPWEKIGHGESWRKIFCAAVQEATNIVIVDSTVITEIDRQAEDACRTWFKSSGQRDFLRAMRVKGI